MIHLGRTLTLPTFVVLTVAMVAAVPAAAQANYSVADTLTVIQKPLLNIPAIVRPGDPVPINCDASPTTTGWTASLRRGGLDIPLSIESATYDPQTLWWTLAVTAPDPPVFDQYDLRVTADGGLDDTVRKAVKLIPAFRDTFEVIQITDTHLPTFLYYYQTGALTDSTTSQNLRAITRDVNIINPEFVILTGDLVNEGELEDYLGAHYYSRAVMHLNEFTVPVYLTAGNHDLGGWSDTPPSDGTARRDWWKFFGWKRLDNPPPGAPAHTQDYSFDYGPIHFTGLEAYNNYDSWRPQIYGSHSFTGDQLSWLSADLAASSAAARHVAFYHRDFQYQLNLGSLGVDLALSGHTHSDTDDPTYPMNVITDNAGGQNRPFRLVRFNGTDIVPENTMSAQNENTLEVTYTPNNDGEAVEVTAVVHNGHGEAFSHGLVRINVPSGVGYEAFGGTLTQVDDTGGHAVCYVEMALPAYTDVTVGVRVDTLHVTGVPARAAPGLTVYPNPFNPRTEVSFELDQAAACRLAVYDLSGRMVATLWEGFREAGRQTEIWDGSDQTGRPMPSGMYIAALRAGTYSEARKLMLAR